MTEKTPLSPAHMASYGSTATRVPVLKKRSRHLESREILHNIDESRKSGAKLFALLHYLRDLDAETGINPWWTILEEKRFYEERFLRTTIVQDSDKRIDRELVCHALQDAHHEYLRAFYAVVDVCAANGYSYYVCTRETIGYLDEIGAPVEKRMRSYVLMFNGYAPPHHLPRVASWARYEMEHLALLRSVPRKTVHPRPLLLPAPSRRSSASPPPSPTGPVLTSRSEASEDEESSSTDFGPDDTTFILDTAPHKDFISIRRTPGVTVQ
jgi:hypothetical protein